MDGAGTISGRWALAAGRAAVKGCRICHGPTLPGMRLCTQCKAALKRARQATVSELIPPPSARSAAVRPPRRAKAAPLAKPLPTPSASSSYLRGAGATAIVLSIVAAAGIGYAALRLVRAVPASLPAPPVASTPAPVGPDPAPAARLEPAPLSAPREAPTMFVAPASASRPVPRSAPSKRAAEPAPAPLPPEPPAIARFATATEPPAPTPVVAPSAPRPAPPPDRWQLMADAVAQCGREGFLAGVICDQRVRLQYCEGYWGQVPQCPSGINNDHGR